MSRMAAVTFDTLKFARTLEAAGVPAPQAEAIATAVRDSTESADLVTRKDLQIELQPIKSELGALRQEFKADLSELEQRMTVRLGAMLVVAVGAVAALVKL
jgi:hypothetical protein